MQDRQHEARKIVLGFADVLLRDDHKLTWGGCWVIAHPTSHLGEFEARENPVMAAEIQAPRHGRTLWRSLNFKAPALRQWSGFPEFQRILAELDEAPHDAIPVVVLFPANGDQEAPELILVNRDDLQRGKLGSGPT